jgi:hypothetical protein
MPDWGAFVRERLARLGLGAERDEEIRAELAEHLEDAYQNALERGLPPEAAMVFAREQVPDWQRLARKIRRAGQEEDDVSHTAKTLWVPGMTALLGATLLLFVMTSLVPPTTWVDAKPPMLRLADMLAPGEEAEPAWVDARPAVLLLGIWMFSYLAFGALGAYWSRRAGGSMAARFLSGTFPLTLHLAIFFLPILVALFSDVPNFPEHRQLSWLLRTSIVWVVIPGVALAIGTLPFLRDAVEKASPAGAR